MGVTEIEDKIPPHSLEAERIVLAGLLLDSEARDMVSSNLMSADFYAKFHRCVFSAIEYFGQNGQPINLVTVYEYLNHKGEINDANSSDSCGLEYIFELMRNTAGVTDIITYVDIVKECATLRKIINMANRVANDAYFPKGLHSNDLLDIAESKIHHISERRNRCDGGLTLAADFLPKMMEKIDFAAQSKRVVTGISTGFRDLDCITNGLQNSDLIIIAGRPSMGKTTLAMNIAEHASVHSGKAVLFFSMEMPADKILMRSVASIGQVDATRLRTGALDDRDWDNLADASQILKTRSKMYIDDTTNLTPAEMRSRCRRFIREHGEVGVIVVDYLQLMNIPGVPYNRTLEISGISSSLKALAKELQVPVIALSQLNRALERRSDRRPRMSDLRESGAIEQDADVIMFVYRDEVYNPESDDKGIAELIINKHKNGPIGTVRLSFQGHINRFSNFEN